MSRRVEGSCSLDHLISNFTGYFKDEVEEEQRDVWVECRLRGRLRGVDEGEEVSEEGRPLVKIGVEEEEGQGMRELVADILGEGQHGERGRREIHAQDALDSACP